MNQLYIEVDFESDMSSNAKLQEQALTQVKRGLSRRNLFYHLAHHPM